jgi:hypothetical protein
MPTKTDVRRLLKKGLTGKEAARLILQDSWEVDNEREGFLSESDIQAIKGSLKTAEDIQDYNKWVELYRLIDYSLIDAERAYLYISMIIHQSVPAVMSFYTAEQVRRLSHDLPQIVTAKQYEDIKAAQRQRHMEDIVSLWELIEWLEHEALVPAEVLQEWEGFEPVTDEQVSYSYSTWLLNEKPTLFTATYVPYLIQLIKSEMLSPVMLSAAEQEELEKLRESRRRGWYNDWLSLKGQSYKRAKSRKRNPARLISQLERLKDGRMSAAEGERLLSYSYCVGQEVYEAGIAGYVELVDQFQPGIYGAPYAYAILQEEGIPEGDEPPTDERGYYDQSWQTRILSELTDLDIFQAAFSSLDTEEPGSGLKGVLIGRHAEIMVRLKAFLAIYSVMEACSEITGIPFIEKLQNWYKIIKAQVNQYNHALKQANLSGHYEYYEGPEVKLPPLDIERLKPDPEHLQYMRERMAIALGPDWFRDTTLRLLEESYVLTAEEVGEIREEQERRGQYSPFKEWLDNQEATDE